MTQFYITFIQTITPTLKNINTLENTLTVENLYEKSYLVSKSTILKIPQKQGNKEGCLSVRYTSK
jgi:plasmid replication initiation protein